MKKFAVILSGCGVFDGSEVAETTLRLYAISRHGAQYEIFAPDIPQKHVINHLTGETTNESRNVLVESARIARGAIKPLDKLDPAAFDGLLMPGGFGAAKNLSGWAFEGAGGSVLPELEEVLKKAVELGKPIGALCISPVILARIFGNIRLTIGSDESTIAGLEEMGAEHVKTTHGEVVIDEKHRLVTTPCYMLDSTIVQIGEGTEAAVEAMLNMME